MKVKRILHIIGSMNRAGAETMLMNLYRVIDKNKYQFDFVYFIDDASDYDSEILELGGRIYKIAGTTPFKRMFALKKLLLCYPEYQIIHCHTLFSNAFHLWAAKKANVPYRIAHSHNTSDKSKNKLITTLYQNFSKILIKRYVTHYVGCGRAASKFLFSEQKDVLFLPNAVDTKPLSEIGAIESNYINNEFNLNKDCLKIIQVGRLQEVKNPFFSIKVAKEMKRKGINFKMFFVGQGELYDNLKREISSKNLTKEIHLLGLRKDIPQLMAGADVLLMPSLYEGFPVVLVESQSVGVPALISDMISSEVDMKVNLIEFESLNRGVSIWVDKLLKLKSQEKLAVKLRVHKIAEQGFDIHSSTKLLMNLYNSMK
jgi:glycosyltransferase EpsF